MSRPRISVQRILIPAAIYVLFLFVIGELPSRPGAATIGLTLVWYGQILWEIRSLTRPRRA